MNPLTRERYDKLRRKFRKQLLRSVDPTEGLLSELGAIERFKQQIRHIRSKTTTEERADRILLLPISEYFDETVSPFLSALSNNGHAHIANVFTTGSNEDLLADDKYELLQKRLAELCTYLDPECGMIPLLRSAGVFDECDEERIMAQRTPENKAQQTITILSHKSNSSYETFVKILQDCDQEHIVYILTGTGSPPISKENRRVISIQQTTIIKCMASMEIPFAAALVSHGVFTEVDKHRVKAINVRHERNEEILNILMRKSMRHLIKFIVALKSTSQDHVAELLKDLQITGALEMNLSDSSAEQEDIEEPLLTAINRDLQDENSVIRREMERLGIHDCYVESGCIRICFKFLTKDALNEMQRGALDKVFTERYCARFAADGLQSIRIKIPQEELKRCEQILDDRKAPMAPEHMHALKEAKEKISGDISVDEGLLKQLSLCEFRQDAILSQSNSEERAGVLLEVMICRPDCEFQQLVHALHTTGQSRAANFIVRKSKDYWRSWSTGNCNSQNERSVRNERNYLSTA